jgi:hypothetical protein
MDSEDVSRETSLRSVCGEILHPVLGGKISPLRSGQRLSIAPGPLSRPGTLLLLKPHRGFRQVDEELRNYSVLKPLKGFKQPNSLDLTFRTELPTVNGRR